MRRGTWLALVLAPALLVTPWLSGCPKVAPASVDAGAALPPVPAPDGLLAAGVVASPDTTWRRLQKMMGGVAALLPMSFGGVLSSMGGLDPAVGAEVDGVAPAYVSLAGRPDDPEYVIAARLSNPAHARGVMFDAETARYGSREEDGVTYIVSKGAALPTAAAVTKDGWLLVAKNEAALKKLGAYTWRMLPERPLPKEAVALEIPSGAFAEGVKVLRAQWADQKRDLADQDKAMRDQRGRSADFGDPAQILAQVDAFFSKRIDEIDDISGGKVTLDLRESSVLLAVELAPREGPFRKRVDAMPVTGPEPLLAATADAELTCVFTDTEAQKGEDLATLVEAARASMGARLGEPERKKLADLAADWRAGRGKVLTVSVVRMPAKGIVVTTAPDDRDALLRALRGVADVLRIANVKEALHAKDLATEKRNDPRLGKLEITTVKVPRPADPTRKEKAEDRIYGVAHAEAKGEIVFVLGEEPAKLLSTYGWKERRCGDDDALKLPIERIAQRFSFAMVAQPFKLDPARLGVGPAPVVMAWGRQDNRAVLRAEISAALLGILAKRQLGL